VRGDVDRLCRHIRPYLRNADAGEGRLYEACDGQWPDEKAAAFLEAPFLVQSRRLVEESQSKHHPSDCHEGQQDKEAALEHASKGDEQCNRQGKQWTAADRQSHDKGAAGRGDRRYHLNGHTARFQGNDSEVQGTKAEPGGQVVGVGDADCSVQANPRIGTAIQRHIGQRTDADGENRYGRPVHEPSTQGKALNGNKPNHPRDHRSDVIVHE
jgi:hypothetical protein